MSNNVFSFLQSPSWSLVLSGVGIWKAFLFTEAAVKRTNLVPSGDYIHLFDWPKRILIILDSSRDSFVVNYRGAADYFDIIFSISQWCLDSLALFTTGGDRRFESQAYCILLANFVLDLVDYNFVE